MYRLGILITGSRDFKDYDFVRSLFFPYSNLYKKEHVILYEGGQVSKEKACFNPEYWGADYIAKTIAHELGWTIKSYYAKWKLHGKKAGIIRNIEMIDAFYTSKEISEKVVIALPLEGSVGTIHAKNYAISQKIKTLTYFYPDPTPQRC